LAAHPDCRPAIPPPDGIPKAWQATQRGRKQFSGHLGRCLQDGVVVADAHRRSDRSPKELELLLEAVGGLHPLDMVQWKGKLVEGGHDHKDRTGRQRMRRNLSGDAHQGG